MQALEGTEGNHKMHAGTQDDPAYVSDGDSDFRGFAIDNDKIVINIDDDKSVEAMTDDTRPVPNSYGEVEI